MSDTSDPYRAMRGMIAESPVLVDNLAALANQSAALSAFLRIKLSNKC